MMEPIDVQRILIQDNHDAVVEAILNKPGFRRDVSPTPAEINAAATDIARREAINSARTN